VSWNTKSRGTFQLGLSHARPTTITPRYYSNRSVPASLSACETAVGDPTVPDEVVHLAGGLQFAGVKSIIGTFWTVDDSTVQHLVKAFYKDLCGDGMMNSRRAARALHRAVKSPASDECIPFDQRICERLDFRGIMGDGRACVMVRRKVLVTDHLVLRL